MAKIKVLSDPDFKLVEFDGFNCGEFAPIRRVRLTGANIREIAL